MTNLSLTAGDFESTRAALAAFMRSQGKFTDYDFEGSNAAALLDILAFNTYTNLAYNNIALAESFRSSAKIRRNVAARAEEIGYVPRSFRSSVATLRVVIKSNTARGVIVIPKGTMFTTRVDGRMFTFTTNENTLAKYTGMLNNQHVFAADIAVYEGVFATDTFVFSEDQTFEISNGKIDTTSLKITVIEDGGQVVLPFSQASTALDLNSQSLVYFLGSSVSGGYQFSFGDNVVGRAPKAGAAIIAEYRVSSGRLPNGAKTFKAAQAIDGETDITVTTLLPATSGDVFEDINDIKFNSSNSLKTQQRAAGEQDYATLLQRENSDIIDVVATGGEKLTPPQYGKVFLSVASTLYNTIPQSRKTELVDFLRRRSMMEPVIVDPDIMFLQVTTNVSFDPNTTNLTTSDIRAFVAAKINEYAASNLGKFNSRFVRSKFVAAVDDSHPAITGNDTVVNIAREVNPATLTSVGVSSTFNNPVSSLTSTVFFYQGRRAILVSDDGDLHIEDQISGERLTLTSIGELDVQSGKFTLSPINVSSSGNIRIIAQGYLASITTPPNTILRLNDDDVSINIV